MPCADPLAGRHRAGDGRQRHLLAQRHAADAAGRRRRARHRREAASRATRSGRRPSRSTSTATTCCPAEGRGEREPAPGLPLLERRRRPDGAALRQLEGPLPGAARQRAGRLGGAVRAACDCPKLFNLRSDPFERAGEDASMYYGKWQADHMFLLVPAQTLVGMFLETFEDVPAAPAAGQLQPGRRGRESAPEARVARRRLRRRGEVRRSTRRRARAASQGPRRAPAPPRRRRAPDRPNRLPSVAHLTIG